MTFGNGPGKNRTTKKKATKKRGPGRPPGSKNKPKASTPVDQTKKDRGEASTDGLPIPDSARQLLLANGQWEKTIPAVVKKDLAAFDKLDKQYSALGKRRTKAKNQLLQRMSEKGMKKIRTPDGKQYIKLTEKEAIEREDIPVAAQRKKTAKKKAAAKKKK